LRGSQLFEEILIIIIRHAWKFIGAILNARYGIKLLAGAACAYFNKKCGIDLTLRGGVRDEKQQNTVTQ